MEFAESQGRDKLQEALANAGLPAGVDLMFLESDGNWLTMDSAQRVIDALVAATPDPRFLRAAGQRTASRAVLGRRYNALQTFGTVMQCYMKVFESAATYNRAGAFNTRRLGRHALQVSYRAKTAEPNRNFCEFRHGQFESIPTIWGLPPARTREVSCQAAGGAACIYEITWTEKPRLILPMLAGLGGALAMQGAGQVFAPLDSLPWLLVAGLLAGGLPIIHSYRRALRERDRKLGEHRGDMVESLKQLREKFAEIQGINSGLEARVERRTNDLRVASEMLQQSLTREQDLASVKSAFVANVSHELRTPLTLILGPLGDIARRIADPAMAKELGVIHNNARVLLRLVNMLLDYATVEAGAARCNLGKSNVGALVQEWVNNAQPQAAQLNIRLQAQGTDAIPSSEFDYEKVETIFTNLLANALKFTPAGGTITCRTFVQGTTLVLEVQDTGCGMTPEQSQHIFERFYQAEPNAEKPQGTGLGLALAKEYATLHGGTLSVDSTLHQGSLFRLVLPRDPVIVERRRAARRREDRAFIPTAVGEGGRNASAKQLRREALLAGSNLRRASQEEIGAEPTPHAAPAGAPRILIAEDNLELRQHMVNVLSRQYQVESVSNGAVALRLARSTLPDLIISDVQMPEMDGFQLCRALRTDSILDSIPFIFVTAWGATDQIVEGLQSGAVDYVVKPFGMPELIARIEAQLRARATQRVLDERNTRLAAIGQSAASIAHDLKSPLQAIKGRAELSLRWTQQLQSSGAADADFAQQCVELKDDLGSIIEAVGHSQRMTEKVLEFVRSGAEIFDKRALDLGPFIEHIGKGIAPELAAVGIELSIHVAKADDLCLAVDQLQLRRALENLLHNAREALASCKKSRPKKIQVHAFAEGPAVIMRVTDNGDGIPTEIRERLFQPFASARKQSGTGLGLALVWNVVTAHEGRINVRAPPPEDGGGAGGTTFEIVLPRVGARAVT